MDASVDHPANLMGDAVDAIDRAPAVQVLVAKEELKDCQEHGHARGGRSDFRRLVAPPNRQIGKLEPVRRGSFRLKSPLAEGIALRPDSAAEIYTTMHKDRETPTLHAEAMFAE